MICVAQLVSPTPQPQGMSVTPEQGERVQQENWAIHVSMSGLQGALQSLNGGAELLVPTSQASVAQTTQTSRQTDTIENRYDQLSVSGRITCTERKEKPAKAE
jgi:hypothetical protein